MNSRLIFLLPFFVLFSARAIAAPPVELVVLQTQYEHALAQRVTAVHESAVGALNAKFTTALDNAISQAKGAGDLPAVLAIQGDKKLLAEKQPLPADEDKTPEALKKLRAIYRDQLTKLTEQRGVNVAALLTPYAARLKELEATLTKADRISEAQEVLTYREGLEAGAPPVASAQSPGPDKPATAAVPESRSVSTLKPSEAAAASRQLAEWCLNNRHEIEILVERRKVRVSNLQDLPKDKFELVGIDYESSLQAGMPSPFPWPALRGVPNITSLYLDLNGKEVSMADLAHLEALKQLNTLNLGGEIAWTDFDLKKLPVLPTVKILVFAKATQTTDMAVLLEKFPKLGSITFASFNAEGIPGLAEAFEKLKQWPGLYELRVDGSGNDLKPEHIAALAKLPELHNLSLYPFDAVIDPSIKTLTRIDKVSLSYSCPADTFRAVLAMPGLTSIMVNNNKKVVDADLAVFTTLTKVTELKLYNLTSLTDACIVHITALKALSSLDLSGSPFTDAALPELAKMRKLKKLIMRKTGITDTAAAAFKKQRPDIEFTR
ncbi:MAG: hypothetical protein V4662_08235 [Verrucomicrobiota bacterium]